LFQAALEALLDLILGDIVDLHAYRSHRIAHVEKARYSIAAALR
jgi:hypothetical protein